MVEAIGKPVNLVALSNGGPPAILAALLAPDLVKTLVLYEPNLPDLLFDGTEEEVAAVEAFFAGMDDVGAAVEAGDDAEAARALVEAIYALPEGGFETLDPVQKTMVLDNAHTFDLLWNGPDAIPINCEDPSGIKAPTLVVNGGDTLAAWRIEAEVIAGCIPGATRAEIVGVGHNGILAAKDEFLGLTLQFVDTH